MNTFAGSKRAGLAGAVLSLLVFLAVPAAIGSGITMLHSFSGDDGRILMGRLFHSQVGRFYGTTSKGGTNDRGVIFGVHPNGTEFQAIRSLGDFDIDDPFAGVVPRSDGLLSGLTCFLNPQLRIYRGDDEIALNDDRELALRALFGPTGAFDLPNDSRDAAVRVPFSSGGDTVHATGVAGSTGVALIKFYESQ